MTRGTTDPRRALPSVASLLEEPAIAKLLQIAPRSAVADAVRTVLERARASAADNPTNTPASTEEWVSAVERELRAEETGTLRGVINATGVVLHTNLGRAPLAQEALDAIGTVAAGYSTLEYEMTTGERGSRHDHCRRQLCAVTAAEDALVVNNGAAALVLALNTLADGRDVIVSRGELVEIGGSFRIPEIMARSGARLVEVGTTNRTHLLDYRAAITERTAAIVKVHRSNFRVSGFTAEATLSELAALGAERGIPLVFDQGSGLLIPLMQFSFPAEPTAADAIHAGADLVLMSGDKLLGGPQAGIVVGREELVARMRKNPLARALRVDKLTLAALDATLALYRDPADAVEKIPTLAMLCAPLEAVRERAARLTTTLRAAGVKASVVDSEAAAGAGAFPVHVIPSAAVALEGRADEIAGKLRAASPPVIAHARDGAVLLDLRSVLPEEDLRLAVAVTTALRHQRSTTTA